MKKRSAFVASAAATLFLAGVHGTAQAGDEGAEAKVKCEGVNSCKGHGECKTATNECAGKNECRGHGFVMMSAAECDAAKAKAAKEE
jgi:hypothetical protein